MDAFGYGEYEYTNEYNIIAYFGDKKHNITFNDTFSEFESIRDGDNEVVIVPKTFHYTKNGELVKHVPDADLLLADPSFDAWVNFLKE